MTDDKPLLWIIDSDRQSLAQCLEIFDGWADVVYVGPGQVVPDWEAPPDAVFFSAEIAGGADGALFAELCHEAGGIPLLAVARLRSLAQAVAFFRAGATDYLPLPLDEDDTRERLDAALVKAARQAAQGMLVELEPLDRDAGDVSLSLRAAPTPDAAEDDDILARLDGNAAEPATPPAPPAAEAEAPATESADEAAPDEAARDEAVSEPEEEEPEPVDGLPIPTLWEELPCGLLVFDSGGNLVFSNSLGLDLFGYGTLTELEDALESRVAVFNAFGANHKPLADNQWPHILARKTHTPRSAVISVERPDRRRVWLRIDCLPHLADGKVNRLSMTLVNLTGELPPLVTAPAAPATPPVKRSRAKARGKRRK